MSIKDKFVGYKEPEKVEEIVSNINEEVKVPLLSIKPIPNLQLDEVNVVFDMEVNQNVSNKDK